MLRIALTALERILLRGVAGSPKICSLLAFMSDGDSHLGDEVRIRQEKLLQDVQHREHGPQFLPQAQPLSCSTCCWPPGFWIDALLAGLWGLRRGKQPSEKGGSLGDQVPWPVGIAEERAGGQHGVGKHACG